MIAELMLAASVGLDTCSECTSSARKVVLCALHVEQERSALNAAKKTLASKVERERIAALEALASLTEAHSNAPSETVARRIAAALGDGSAAVRGRAVELLGPPQHALRCMDALLEAFESASEDLRRAQKEGRELLRESYRARREEERQEARAELKANELRQESLSAWRRRLLDQLAHFADDRVVATLRASSDSILETLARTSKIDDPLDRWEAYEAAIYRLPSAMDVNAPLARIGSRQAIVQVLRNLVVLEAEIAQLRDAVAEPSGLVGLDDKQLSMYRELVEAGKRTVSDVAAALTEKAIGAPLPAKVGLEQLVAWLERNQRAFPERLPGVSSPAW